MVPFAFTFFQTDQNNKNLTKSNWGILKIAKTSVPKLAIVLFEKDLPSRWVYPCSQLDELILKDICLLSKAFTQMTS